jgi:hypothetical protein
LAAKAEIATCSEPWIALPLVYLTRKQGTLAEYSHKVSQIGIEDFIEELDGGHAFYNKECAKFIRNLYSNIATTQDAKYFLDKTPRYYLIIDEILSMFPDGKFIFLWRNPLSVATSISNTWANGQWNLSQYSTDIYKGLTNLVDAYEKYHEQCISISYEELVTNKNETCDKVFSFLDIPLGNGNYSMNDAAVHGRLGDKSGKALYSNVDSGPLAKWEDWVCNPIRRKWCNDYLDWIGASRLQIMGYSMKQMKERLMDTHVNLDRIPSDLKRIIREAIRRKVIKLTPNVYE